VIMTIFHVRRLVQLLSGLVLLIIAPADLSAAEQPIALKPEKDRLEVGTAGSGTTSLPLLVALEAGYFTKRGLKVSVNQVGATVAVQGVISGTIDIYQGEPLPSRRISRERILSMSPPPLTGIRSFCLAKRE
jgi:ABC-type nitrate/sulfonate/bicarbonate transport system substrate-binding protein